MIFAGLSFVALELMDVSFASEGFWQAFQKMGAPVCKSLLKEALCQIKRGLEAQIFDSCGITCVSESQNHLNGNEHVLVSILSSGFVQ